MQKWYIEDEALLCPINYKDEFAGHERVTEKLKINQSEDSILSPLKGYVEHIRNVNKF